MPTKMKYHLWHENENESHLCLGYITELSYGSVANNWPNANEIFGTKTKNKTKMKIQFRPKTKKAEND